MSIRNASVSVSLTINAEPETVWRFLSEQDKLLSWMTFIPGSPTPPGSRFEPRPGGELRIIFPNGGEARGQVVALEPNKKLVFTWGYDPDVAKTGLGPGACRVEVALSPTTTGDGTRVTLTHSGPMSDELAREHESGWRHYLTQLAVRSAEANLARTLEPALTAYFAACNQPDDAARTRLLESCCEPDIRVLTPFACSDTLELLSKNIANGLKHLRGCLSAIDGIAPAAAKHIHGVARVPWKVTMPDGHVLFRGENIVRFTPHGKIAEIVSFHA
jgi:uncharacterized protein YndB with AHSA1/START domain